MELSVLCKSLSTLADFLPAQFVLCSDSLLAVQVSQSPEFPLCTKAVHELSLFECGFDIDSLHARLYRYPWKCGCSHCCYRYQSARSLYFL